MPFEPGHPKIPGSGRKKGTLNHRDAALRDGLSDLTLRLMKSVNALVDEWDGQKLWRNEEKPAIKLFMELITRTVPRRPLVIKEYEGPEDVGEEQGSAQTPAASGQSLDVPTPEANDSAS